MLYLYVFTGRVFSDHLIYHIGKTQWRLYSLHGPCMWLPVPWCRFTRFAQSISSRKPVHLGHKFASLFTKGITLSPCLLGSEFSVLVCLYKHLCFLSCVCSVIYSPTFPSMSGTPSGVPVSRSVHTHQHTLTCAHQHMCACTHTHTHLHTAWQAVRSQHTPDVLVLLTCAHSLSTGLTFLGLSPQVPPTLPVGSMLDNLHATYCDLHTPFLESDFTFSRVVNSYSPWHCFLKLSLHFTFSWGHRSVCLDLCLLHHISPYKTKSTYLFISSFAE